MLLSGDVETSQDYGSTDEAFSICHRNLNKLPDYNNKSLFLLKAYIAVHKLKLICLFEADLDTTVASDDKNLEIIGYNVARSDHPANTKGIWVCLYYKTCLSLLITWDNLSRTNSFLPLASDNFNSKSKFWYCNDNTTYQGKALENVTSQFGLHQLMKNKHIL